KSASGKQWWLVVKIFGRGEKFFEKKSSIATTVLSISATVPNAATVPSIAATVPIKCCHCAIKCCHCAHQTLPLCHQMLPLCHQMLPLCHQLQPLCHQTLPLVPIICCQWAHQMRPVCPLNAASMPLNAPSVTPACLPPARHLPCLGGVGGDSDERGPPCVSCHPHLTSSPPDRRPIAVPVISAN
ncbi:hypothetical protein AB205_0081380, partial [Aquarana catesbeiana]